MSTHKRSALILKNHFRKSSSTTSNLNRMPKLKPLVAAIATLLVGCSNKQEAQLVQSVEDCLQNTDFSETECETAYQNALAEAENTAPKYQSMNQCETEFGPQQCTRSSSGFFMPFMAGYLMSSLLDSGRNHYNPVYHYRGRGPYSGKILSADGRVLGRAGSRSYNVSRDVLTKPMPTVRKTVSRGGFGAQAAAKSNWGGSTRRSGGWGG